MLLQNTRLSIANMRRPTRSLGLLITGLLSLSRQGIFALDVSYVLFTSEPPASSSSPCMSLVTVTTTVFQNPRLDDANVDVSMFAQATSHTSVSLTPQLVIDTSSEPIQSLGSLIGESGGMRSAALSIQKTSSSVYSKKNGDEGRGVFSQQRYMQSGGSSATSLTARTSDNKTLTPFITHAESRKSMASGVGISSMESSPFPVASSATSEASFTSGTKRAAISGCVASNDIVHGYNVAHSASLHATTSSGSIASVGKHCTRKLTSRRKTSGSATMSPASLVVDHSRSSATATGR